MKEAELVRVGRRLYAADGSFHEDCKTINAAKRASRVYQKKHGTMGDGRVRVAARKPS